MIDRIVFEVEFFYAKCLTQPLGADQRREAGVKSRLGFARERKKLAVTPKISRPGGNLFPGKAALDLLVVVNHLEGAKTAFTNVQRLFWVVLPTFSAL